MNEWRIKMNEWWTSLALREKQAVSIGGSLLGLFIFYMAIWSPYLDRVDNMRQRIQTEQKTLSWMEAADKEIHKIENQSQQKSEAATPVVLLSYLQKQVTRTGLESSLSQLKQSSNDSIEMHFQKADFDKLVGMLISVAREQNIAISQMSATADNTPGMVAADVVLRLG
jgi:general secretion pathway protein M